MKKETRKAVDRVIQNELSKCNDHLSIVALLFERRLLEGDNQSPTHSLNLVGEIHRAFHSKYAEAANASVEFMKSQHVTVSKIEIDEMKDKFRESIKINGTTFFGKYIFSALKKWAAIIALMKQCRICFVETQ